MVGRPWRVIVGQGGGQEQQTCNISASLAGRTSSLTSHGHLKSTSCLPPHCTQTQAHVSYGNQGCHGLQAVGADLCQPGFEQRPRTAASGARARPSFEENLVQLG